MSGDLSRRRALVLGGGVLLGGGAAALGAGTGAASTAATSDWIRLPVITANIGRKNLGAREAAIRDVRNGDPGHRPLVGWQEICEGDTGERPMINRYFGDYYRKPFMWHDKAYRVPMAIPTHWKIFSRRATFVHGGIRKVTPPRWITEVALQHVRYPELQFALINTHYIANAFNGDQRRDLRDEWRKHKSLHKELVLAHHRKGRPVIWTGDTNRPDYTTATGWQAERQVFHNGIDKVNWMPGNNRIQLQLLNKKRIDMRVDGHDARLAIFRIRLA